MEEDVCLQRRNADAPEKAETTGEGGNGRKRPETSEKVGKRKVEENSSRKTVNDERSRDKEMKARKAKTIAIDHCTIEKQRVRPYL